MTTLETGQLAFGRLAGQVLHFAGFWRKALGQNTPS
jgi:hypothetical protein